MPKQPLISGVHNYCDRWCERCRFLDRCAVGAIELERWAKGQDWQPEDFFRELDAMFHLTTLEKPDWLAEMEFSRDDLEAEDPDPQLEALQKAVQERGMHYFRGVQEFLKAQKEQLKAHHIDLDAAFAEGRDQQERSELAEALEVIHWYLHFMFVKGCRALGGLEDMHDEHWGGAHQSDANGSAKIAMIAVQRSMGAWEVVRRHWPERQLTIAGFIREINQFRRLLERYFPDWHKFIRPGFDTEPSAAPEFGSN
ncbi:MAG: hypothetical protein ABIQ93_12260 [Saprospiraceae bacterium]